MHTRVRFYILIVLYFHYLWHLGAIVEGGVEVRVGVLEDTSLGELPRFAEHQLGTACRGMCVQTKTGVHPYLRGTDRKRIPDEIVEQLHPGSAAHNLAYAPVAELPTQAIRGLRQPGIDEVRLA